MRAHAPCVSYVGLRADEETRLGMIFPEEAGIQVRTPMREWGWGINEVWDCLRRHDVTIPDRTNCNGCFWSKLGELYVLWRDDREAFDLGADIEDEVSAARGRPYTFRSPQRDTWPASRRDLGAEFARGRIPTRFLQMMERDKRRETGSCRACTL